MSAALLGCHGYQWRLGANPAAAVAAWRRLGRYLSTGEAGQNQRHQQDQQQQQQQQHKSVIFSDQRARPSSYANLTPAQKVIEGSKDAGYGLVVLAGVLVTGGLFYALWRELFSSRSASALQSLALARCLADPQVQAALGEPIRSHGEGSSRRSRSRLAAEESIDADGVKLMTMRFYLEGQFNKADVYVQGYMPDDKTWRMRLLLVELQRYPKRVIVLEKEDPAKNSPPPVLLLSTD